MLYHKSSVYVHCEWFRKARCWHYGVFLFNLMGKTLVGKMFSLDDLQLLLIGLTKYIIPSVPLPDLVPLRP